MRKTKGVNSRKRKTNPLPIVKEVVENSNVEKIDEVVEEEEAHSSGTTVEYQSQSVSTQTDDESPAKKRKSDWQILKPQNTSSLFYEIVTSKDIAETVHSWVESYGIDAREPTILIIQFIVDLCGYQDFNIEDSLNKKKWYMQIAGLLEKTKRPEIDYTNKYFINIRKKQFKQYQDKIDYFLVHVIIESHHRKIFQEPENWLCYAATILKDLSMSQKTYIRHTSVFIGLKFLTGLIHVSSKVLRKMNEIKETVEYREEVLEEIKMYLKKMDKFIKIFYKYIFKPNWNLMDKKLYIMRFDCISEMDKWFSYVPITEFPHNELLRILEVALVDPHKQVRFATLQVVYNFLKNENCVEKGLVQEYFKHLVTAIAKRRNDIDSTVTVFAIDTLGRIDKNIKSIPQNIRKEILMLIYCGNFQLGRAAANLLIQDLNDDAKNDEELLLNIIRFQIHIEQTASYENMFARRPLLVDSLFNQIPVLTAIETYVSLLKNLTLVHNEKEILADILGEVLLILTTGKSEINRLKKSREIDVERNNTILKVVLQNVRIWGQNFSLKRFKFIYKFLEDFKKTQPEEFLPAAAELKNNRNLA